MLHYLHSRHLLARARALDNQCHVCMCSPARDTTAKYVAFGHSLAVNPWGTIVSETDETESVVFADLDLPHVIKVRQEIPVLSKRRNDLYKTEKL